jgi:hypothetical protein
MGHQIEFMDCPTCGKRMATTATLCRHCGNAPIAARRIPSLLNANEDLDEELDDSHMASDGGGYDGDEEGFDYDEFIENEFGDKSSSVRPKGVKLWVWITAWILLIAICLSSFTILIMR